MTVLSPTPPVFIMTAVGSLDPTYVINYIFFSTTWKYPDF
jgi:hypothetical protein